MTRRLTLLAVVVLGLLALPACSVLDHDEGTYPISAEFTRAIGVYPGSPVRQLGIDVGHIAHVENEGDVVRVDMRIEDGTELPADTRAVIVPVTALGERYIQLGPVYDDGPVLDPGTTIPTSRTQVPFEIDELLRGLQSYLGAIDPEHATDLVHNLAAVVEGQGQEINDLIRTGADTLDVLADKGDELGTIVDSLAELSEALGGRTRTIQQLVRSYDAVSGVLADNDEAINRFVLDLNDAAVEVRSLLADHDQPLRDDIGNLTGLGRTLQRNIDRLRLAIASTPRLFAAAQLAYDPQHNVLPLNNAGDPSFTGDLYQSRLRDRLAGLCRRLIVMFTGTELGTALADSGCASSESAFWADLFESDGPPPLEVPTPGAVEPPSLPPLPGPPDPSAVLNRGIGLILSLLDGAQADALRGLSADLVAAIAQLSPEQLQELTLLTPEQLAQLREVDPARLGQVLDRLARQQFDPTDVLDAPALPSGGDDGGNPLLPGLGG